MNQGKSPTNQVQLLPLLLTIKKPHVGNRLRFLLNCINSPLCHLYFYYSFKLSHSLHSLVKINPLK